jgi:hypothetical protein
MRRIIYALFCLLLSLENSGQDTNHVVAKKMKFTIQAASCYKTFLGRKYIEPTPYKYGDEFRDHQYERFNKIPAFGFSAGFLFIYDFNKYWGCASGFQYFLRNDIFENNQDTVIKYGNGSSMRDIHNTLKYKYLHNNLELQILFLYKLRRFKVMTGFQMVVMSYRIAKYTYVVYQYSGNPQWAISDKTVSQFEHPLMLLPTIQCSYKIKMKNFTLNPFLGFDFGINNFKSLYIKYGVIF